MANPSILAAFERMWQHIITALGNKADLDHTHDEFVTHEYVDNAIDEISTEGLATIEYVDNLQGINVGKINGIFAEVFNDYIDNKATGDFSHSEGLSTIASGNAQHVQGQFNIEDESDTYAHIVGNGSDNYDRSNAHTLDWSGNAWFSGEVKIGGTGQDDPEAQTLATKEYVDSHTYEPEGGLTDEELIELLVEMKVIEPILVDSNEVTYVDKDGSFYTL